MEGASSGPDAFGAAGGVAPTGVTGGQPGVPAGVPANPPVPGDTATVGPVQQMGTQAPVMQPVAAGQNMAMSQKEVQSKKENGWVKFLRFLIWAVSFVAAAGFWTIWQGAFAARYLADGTAIQRYEVGRLGFWIAVGVFCANLLWGLVRWVMRIVRRKWKVVKIIMQSLWGVVWRGAVYGLVFVVSSLVLAGVLDGMFVREEVAMMRDPVAERDERVSLLLEKEDWTEEEVKQVLREELLAGRLDFGEDASGNVSSGSGWFGQNAYAATDVVTLNKFTISPNRNFVVWWTDVGDEKTTEVAVKRLAERMEYIIDRYEELFGINYEFNSINYNNDETTLLAWFGQSTTTKQKKLLGADAGLTESAMAVYVVRAEGMAGSYLGVSKATLAESATMSVGWAFDAIFNIGGGAIAEVAELYASIPRIPAYTIDADALEGDSYDLIAAHELGHHFQVLYCGGSCTKEKFISETLPQWAASLVIEGQPRGKDNGMAGWHSEYVENLGNCRIDYVGLMVGCDVDGKAKSSEEVKRWKSKECRDLGKSMGMEKKEIDLVCKPIVPLSGWGYAPFGFLYNYDLNVSGGRDKIWGGMVTKKDTLEYLMGEATEGELFATFGSLAEKNLTNDYGTNYALYADKWPRGESLPCEGFCGVEGEVKATRMKYYYFPVRAFSKKQIKVETGGGVGVSVLSTMTGAAWMARERSDGGVEVVVDEYADNAAIAVVVFNYGLEDGAFVLRVTDEEIEKVIDEDLLGIGDWEEIGLRNGCLRFKIDDVFAGIRKIYEVIDEVGETGGVLTNEWDKEVGSARGNIPFEWMSVCIYAVRMEASNEAVRQAMRRIVGSRWAMGLNMDGAEALVAYDMAGRRMRLALYVADETERMILTVATD